ncbi:MAG: beta-ketoacyl reductase, partial [Actinomycetes bacterium]
MHWSRLRLDTVAKTSDTWTVLGERLDLATSSYTDIAELRQAVDDGSPVPSVVLFPMTSRSASGSDLSDRVRATLHRLLDTTKTWLADDRFATARLVVVTRGAIATDGEDITDLTHAGVWGMLRSAQAEHPGRFVVADVDDNVGSRDALIAALHSDEPQLLVRAGEVFVPRLVRAEPRMTVEPDPATGRDWQRGTVMITGGTGALGAVLARHLVTRHGARNLLLLSRRGADAPDAKRLRTELSDLGATVTIAACDVADRDSLAAVLAAVPADQPLAAVVHTAGVVDDGVLATLSSAQLDRVVRPKVDAAWNLHELTKNLDLSAFVLYSSIAGILGTAGQA